MQNSLDITLVTTHTRTIKTRNDCILEEIEYDDFSSDSLTNKNLNNESNTSNTSNTNQQQQHKKSVHFNVNTATNENEATSSPTSSITVTYPINQTNLICLKLPKSKLKMPNLLHRSKSNSSKNEANKETLSSSALIESSLPCNSIHNEDVMLDLASCSSPPSSTTPQATESKQTKYTNRFRSIVFRLFRRHFSSTTTTRSSNKQESKSSNHTTPNNCCCYVERKKSVKKELDSESISTVKQNDLTKTELNCNNLTNNDISQNLTNNTATLHTQTISTNMSETADTSSSNSTSNMFIKPELVLNNSFKSKNTALVKPNRVLSKKLTKDGSNKLDNTLLLLPPLGLHHHPHHQYTHHSNRRESFLYKADTDFDNIIVNKKSIRSASIASEQHQEDLIVTPFAQILASLKNVRQNLINLSNSTNENATTTGDYSSKRESNHLKDETNRQLFSLETLEELDWCLNQLENMQSHKTISDIASTKFKKMLNKELSHFAEHNKSDNQIAEFICSTYLDKKEDIDLPTAKIDQTDSTTNIRIRTSNNNLTKLIQSNLRRASMVNDEDIEENISSSISNKQLNSTGESNQQIIDQSSVSNESKSLATNSLPSSNVNNTTTSKSTQHTMNNIFTINSNKLDDDDGGGISRNDNTNEDLVSSYDIELKKNKPLDDLLKDIDIWGIDIFLVDELSLHRPLTAVVYTIFQKRDIMKTFSINPNTLINYLTVLEDNYQPVPYHNKIHAADVSQSIHVLLNSKALESVFTDLEVFAAIFSAAIHDVDHPGLTNQYLINTGSELALMYNDESVLENHHLAIAFKLLQNGSHDIFANLSKKQRQIIRKMIIDMVLATDMSKHMSLLAELKTMVESKKVSGSGFIVLESYQDRIRVLQNMLHCADLSNPTKPLRIYQLWTSRVMNEFFLQGDRELSEGLEISPMCDRHSASVEKSQVGFIDFIAHPLWESWSDLVAPDAQEILDALENNRIWYCNEADKLNSNSNTTNANSNNKKSSSSSTEEELS